MMVGDPKQAIYVWNGANPEYMNMFEREFSAKRYELKENFRSSRAVVSAARSLFPTYSVVGQLPIAGEIRLLEAQDPRDEAYRVIEYLKRLMASGHEDIEGEITLDKCALLARNRYVFQEVEKLLVHEHLPFYKRLSAQHESESYLIRDFENALRVLANPRDQLHLGMLATRWDVPIDRAMEQNKSDGMQTVRCLATASGNAEAKACLEAIAGMEWSPGGFRFAKALDLLAAYASQIASPEERSLVVEDLGVWRRHWNVFLRTQQQGTQNLAFFLSSVAMGATQQMRQEGLALLTVHSAKGLEFDVVVVMGMTEETFPDYRAMRSSGGLEEESRNAFVAVTRSRRLLAFSYPKRRVMPWGDDTAQKPSRYLEVMGFFTDPGGRS
jgi:DNA helicase-2/ATP-dependent DNA helicase PcrA